MLNKLRPQLKRILEPIAKKININPNIITGISLLIAILSAIMFLNHQLIVGAILILLTGCLDVLDGAVARYHNKATDLGGFLDSTVDRFSDGIIVIGIIAGGYIDWFLGILLIHSSLTISYIRAKAESQSIKCEIGIAERAFRLIVIIIAAIIGGLLSPIYMQWILILLVMLSYFTVAQRIIYVWKNLKNKKKYIFKNKI
ncbi:MAG: CDP-alcohol phosphatidyltransferase family protein [Methanobrevibacter sp.]|nr:CDP-alcohol phosphatidyltransferase family protein [Candidatus Methanoflexus mossambicus]